MQIFLVDSPEQNEQDKQNNFLRQAFSLSGELVPLEYFLQTICLSIRDFVPLDWFSQTRCLWLLIHSITFLRQPVTILAELAAFEKFSKTSCLIPLISIFYNKQSTFRMKENDLQLLLYIIVRLVLLFFGRPFFLWNFARKDTILS